jgi:hypothetical protein
MQRGYHQQRRLLYIPGMISLACLLLLLLQAINNKSNSKLRMMEVDWMVDSIQEYPHLQRNYMSVRITGDKNDKVKLDYVDVITNEMALQHDTVRGIRVSFEKSAKYEAFVRVLKIGDRHENIFCIPSAKDIWILNPYGRQSPMTWECIVHSYPSALADPAWPAFTTKHLPVYLALTLLALVSVRAAHARPFRWSL